MSARFFTPLLLLLATLGWGGVAAASSPDDDAIYDRVRQRLYNDPDVKGYNIDIQVKNGVVTLAGTVTSEKVRNKAERLTRKVSGVKQVINKLQVGEGRPSSSTAATPWRRFPAISSSGRDGCARARALRRCGSRCRGFPPAS